MGVFVPVWLVFPRCEAPIWVCLICVISTYSNGAVQIRVGLELALDVPNRGAQFAADRIAPIRSDLKLHDSNRNPKFRSLYYLDILKIGFKSRDSIRAIRFASGS